MNLHLVVKDPMIRGALALFPVFSDAPSAPHYLTGPEAEAAKAIVVTERDGGAAVPELVVQNVSQQPVLLLEGETVVGAKQNRMLNVSVLVGAGAQVTISVSCVEAGRWGSVHPAARSPRHAPGDLRRRNTMSVAQSRRAGLGPRGDQGAVWDRVAAYQNEMSAPSPTAALEDVYTAVSEEIRTLADVLTPLPDQRGVIVAVGGKVCGIDFFDKVSTLAAYWPALVPGYAIDALHAPHDPATISDAEAFVERMLGADVQSVDAVGLGRDRTIEGSGVTGHALEWDGAVVHLAAFANDNVPPRSPASRPIDRRRWFG